MNTKYNNWFDSKYYHILYKNRNHKEAKIFIKKLIKHINLSSSSKVLDAGCGKGRHSIEIEKLGHIVTGIDLSKNSIKHAKQFEKDNLKFDVADMRATYKKNSFDISLNLFTSFGYFKNKENDADSIKKDVKNPFQEMNDKTEKSKIENDIYVDFEEIDDKENNS